MKKNGRERQQSSTHESSVKYVKMRSSKRPVDRMGKDNLDYLNLDINDEEEEEEEEEEDLTEVAGHKTLFSEQSLQNLTDVLGSELTTMLVMYLNVPTTTLAYMLNAAIRSRRDRNVLDRKMLIYWATLRSTTSTEVKAREILKALRACEQDELAEFVSSLAETNKMFPTPSNYRKMMVEKDDEQDETPPSSAKPKL